MKKIAFVFPGQGSQYIGMGKELYENSECVRNVFAIASDAMQEDMAHLCFEDEKIHQTEYTQPAILTMSMAMERLLRENGIVPDVVAGLSLGEYSALVSANVLDFAEAVKLVRKRGKWMQECIPNGEWRMVAVVGLPNEVVEKTCQKVNGFVKCTNYNCPGQLVIAGTKEAVEEATIKLKELGARKTVELNVKAPFHTTQLTMAKEKLQEELKKTKFRNANIPVIKNIDGLPYETLDDKVEILSNHIISPVYWEKSVQTMIDMGVDTFIEVGPGKTLSGFIRKIDKEKKIYHIEDQASLQEIILSVKEKENGK